MKKFRNVLLLLAVIALLFAFTACDDDDDDDGYDRDAVTADYELTGTIVGIFEDARADGACSTYTTYNETEYRLTANTSEVTDETYGTITVLLGSEYDIENYTSSSRVKHEWDLKATVQASDATVATLYKIDVEVVLKADGTVYSAELEINNSDLKVSKDTVYNLVAEYITV